MGGDITLTRSYSNRSAGKLSSGKGPTGAPHTLAGLLSEFEKHKELDNKIPTSLVSTSDRIIDTLKRAFNTYYDLGQSPDQIWIVFITIPYDWIRTKKVHSARELANKCQNPKAEMFKHEFLFEWAIPQEFVVHSVSIKTLIARGLNMDPHRRFCYSAASACDKYILPPVSCLCEIMADEYIRYSYDDGWDVGVGLGLFAKRFGARAPLDWIAQQLYYDLTTAPEVDRDGDLHFGSVSYEDGKTEDLDLSFFPQVEDGIHTALFEWWLLDEDFILGLKAFNEWRELHLELMVDRWIDFSEDWCGYGDGTVGYKSAKERLEHWEERLHADIEKAAIEVGL